MKYSSGYWDEGVTDIGESEARMLALTCQRAELTDGQEILELGCGWGSLTLWMASHYPNAKITAVSNSRTQREHIMAEAEKRNLPNVEVITANMITFEGVGAVSLRSLRISRNVRAHEELSDSSPTRFQLAKA